MDKVYEIPGPGVRDEEVVDLSRYTFVGYGGLEVEIVGLPDWAKNRPTNRCLRLAFLTLRDGVSETAGNYSQINISP